MKFNDHLDEKLKDDDFRSRFEEEKALLDLSLKILELRTQKGFTQKHLAEIAHITQQQLSKAERGVNCNISTFLKICHALNIKLTIQHINP